MSNKIDELCERYAIHILKKAKDENKPLTVEDLKKTLDEMIYLSSRI